MATLENTCLKSVHNYNYCFSSIFVTTVNYSNHDYRTKQRNEKVQTCNYRFSSKIFPTLVRVGFGLFP